eukprot:Rhum_TRINITY_DN22865_c0_g1::Rhum_TRINITY_DN22865_c0_g1_i1::g.176294::m.176294/K08493/VTI1; vesicle transport through interaction with t-SNAREs 1
MSSVHEVYEEEYKDAIKVVKDYVESDGASEGVDMPKAREALQTAEDAIKELSRVQGEFEMKVQLTQYKKEVQRVKVLLESIQSKLDREALLSGGQLEKLPESSEFNRGIAAQNVALQRQGNRIDDALRITQETEMTGVGIMGNLTRQGEDIEQQIETLDTTNDKITAARQLVSNLHRRIIQNKLMLYGVAGVLAILIIILVAAS